MKNLIRILPVLAVAAIIGGCSGPCQKIDTISGPALTTGTADFSNVVAVGTSISAGYQSGGVVNRHQIRSFPALFAQQVGMTVVSDGTSGFTFNGLSNDGVSGYPPTYTLLEIKSLSPLVINNVGRTPGAPQNMANGGLDYHNMAVPGELAVDVVDSTLYTVDPNPVRGANYNKFYWNIIYRGRGLGIQQLVRRAPTFVTYEFGANEVLGAATAGTANVFPSATYDAAVRGALNTLHAAVPNAKVAVFNVPGVTAIPFCTTFSPVTLDMLTGTPVALLGPNGALSPTDLVLLTAKDSLAIGTGFAVGSYNYLNPAAPGNGRPLTNAQVLNDAEQTTINTTIFNMNASIDSIVANRPWTTKVDFNALLAGIAAEGYTVGSVTYTSDFVTGGLFSLDGVHPTDLAHAIICNTLIDAVNAQWGATIPHLNLSEHATATSSRMRPAGGEALLPTRIDGLQEGIRALFPQSR